MRSECREYLLDSRGQWRAKAYRKNQFESVIDGQLIITIISLISIKFNAFKNYGEGSKLRQLPKR